ncbi:NADP-dependent oxidoreductase domain-containing protein [Suillus subalutaceus]|uniref:NADP-dependent oxidoreductase domain-containing protein n=1 Tax=Suillus subalutaceus TaxID=48586 RepID=UPI001B86B089|nr:NADP-dependent oxidoreductase domain-containing protein [Suillus subalutaceus]KAG1857001.1 NADP-dependent oxidoreductase domain-containing protein [Suillus subalutaceus]
MPWDLVTLNSGYVMPSIAYDTAQGYGNEGEVGIALHESGLSRGDVFITTKYSGFDGLDIHTAIRNSINNIDTPYVDLYLIHNPRLAVPDIPTAWAEMEKVVEDGLARSIGVSNFGVQDLEILLASAKIKPAANQILLHPYVYQKQAPIVKYAAEHGIVIEAYSALQPLTKEPSGPLDAPLNEIATRLGATTDQVLLAWTKAKGAVIVTTSSKKTRLEGYQDAGDIELSKEDIAVIDAAGALGEKRITARIGLRKFGVGVLVGVVVLGLCSYFGVRIDKSLLDLLLCSVAR